MNGGFVHDIEVAAEGTRVGLSLGWKSEVDIELRSFSKNHINVEI